MEGLMALKGLFSPTFPVFRPFIFASVCFIFTSLLIFFPALHDALAGGVVGDGTPGSCIEAALDAALAGGGSVTFNCGTDPVTIPVTGQKNINFDTNIDGGDLISLSGNHTTRIFFINSTTLILTHITLTGGNAGGEIGGAILNWFGTLNILYSTISGNNGSSGGAICNAFGTLHILYSTISGNNGSSGGGIYNRGNLMVTHSVFFDNHANPDNGGAIANAYQGLAEVANSTFYSNTAALFGGAIDNAFDKVITITNSTFSSNNAAYGGAVSQWLCTLTLINTIMANSGGGNCDGTILDGGGNLRWPNTDPSCPNSISYGDPKLGPLADHGGPTLTMALLPYSAAINAGIDAVCAAPPVNNLDQRGIPRPQGAHCDIGAFELQVYALYLPVILRQ